MTRAHFAQLLSNVTVRLVRGPDEGLLVQAMSQGELAEIVTIAGHALGAVTEDTRVNPAWLELGPARDMHLMFHREALPLGGLPDAASEPTLPSSMDHDLDRIASALDRVADAITRLAEAQSGQQPMDPAAQAALDLVLHDSQRIARRLGALDALTPPVAAQPKPSA